MAEQLEVFGSIAFEAERRRLQRLARALLRDEQGAEDAVQDAWVALLRAREDAPREPRTWLAATVHRLASSQRRESARRARREREAARAEREPATDEGAARIEVLRRVLDAVAALDEPYRNAIVQRYLDGVPPRVIARKSGVPVATVRAHVWRGLQRLRSALDSRCKDERSRERFLAALLPVARGDAWTLGIGTAFEAARGGALVMKWRAIAWTLGLVALLAGGTLGWIALERGGGERMEEAAAARSVAKSVAEEPAPSISATADERPESERVAAAPASDFVVSGLVTLARIEPLPDAWLSLRLAAGTSSSGELLAEGRTRTGADGRFAWAVPRPEVDATLFVGAANDDLKLRSEYVLVAGDDPPDALILDAYPIDVVFLGRVIDPEGAPIAGASVKSWTALANAETDADGRFRLRTSSYSPATQCRAVATGFAVEHFDLTRRAAGEWPVADVVLRRAAALQGRLSDEQGRPLSGAEIRSLYFEDRVVLTGEDGRFVVDWLLSDSQGLWLSARAAGFAVQQRRVTADDFAAGAFDWTVERGSIVSGIVRDESGAGVGGARVIAATHPSAYSNVECWSGAGGRFELPLLPPGEFSLRPARSGFVGSSRYVFVPSDGSPVPGVELTLQRGGSLAGQVVNELGRPVPFALIFWNQADEWLVPSHDADAEGRFCIEHLPPAPVSLGFLHAGFVRHEKSFAELGRDDLVVRMTRAGSIAGRVVDGATGEPIPSFRIRFVAASADLGASTMGDYRVAWRRGVPFSGTDGYWSTAAAEDLRIGARTGVEASAEGYASTIVDDVVVQAEPDPDALVIQLFAADAGVRGRVASKMTGEPIEGVLVRAFRGDPTSKTDAGPAVTTDAAGCFELAGLAIGSTSLVVDHPEYGHAIDGPFEIRSGERAHRAIALDPCGRIHGRLVDGSGAPLAGEMVALTRHDDSMRLDPEREQQTDASGAFAFERVEPAEYQLSWRRSFGDGSSADAECRLVELEAGSSDLEVELRPLGRAILRGTLVGNALPVVWIQLEAAPSAVLETDAERVARVHGTFARKDRRFEFEGLQPGRYTVRAVDGTSASATLEVNVPDEGEVSIVLSLEKPR